jgi:putative ABC transport system permease protein
MATSWHLGPILRGMRGHRASAVLVVVQLGIGLALSVLAVLIGDYMVGIFGLSSGMAEDDLTVVELRLPGRSAGGPEAARRRAALLEEARATPGCVGVAVVGQTPLTKLERDADEVRRAGGDPAVLAYELDAGAGIAEVAGLRLRAGRDFTDDDLHADVTAAIISPTFADALWPGEDPLGAGFLSRSHGPAVVVGIAEQMRTHMIAPDDANVIYAREDPGTPRTLVLVRSAPGRAGEVRAALRAQLPRPGQLVTVTSADRYTRQMTTTVASVLGILGVMVGSIVLVVLIGSMGLTYYLVASRAAEIGVRRAMGARRRDVVRHFLLENAIFTAAGTLLGLGIVLLVVPTLVREQVGFVVRWPLVALVAAAVAALNLAASVIPARKAAAVPPVVAAGNE